MQRARHSHLAKAIERINIRIKVDSAVVELRFELQDGVLWKASLSRLAADVKDDWIVGAGIEFLSSHEIPTGRRRFSIDNARKGYHAQ
jgi:hypothetical protein